MPDIRLIALDLDGTLLDRQNRVADEDAAAVREALAAGIHVVLATSRWHHAARRTALALDVPGPIISHNGALVRDRDNGAVLLHHRIDEALARRLAEHLDRHEDDAYVTVGETTFVRGRRFRARPEGTAPRQMPPEMAAVDAIAPCVTAAPTAFLVFGRDTVRGTVEAFREHHGIDLNLAEGFSDSFPDYLNVVHALADKGSALTAVCEALGVPMEQAMAMGDAAPDIAMLKVAGLGVAMGNAAPPVKEIAAAVAPGNDAGGVAWAIRRYILG